MKLAFRNILVFPAVGLMLCAAAIDRMRPDSNFLVKVSNPPPLIETDKKSDVSDYSEQLRLAILGEEHAWLKTYGYADIQSGLRITPYPERKYPKHAEDDLLPLPTLSAAPKLDGQPDDAAWQAASRDVVRVGGVAGWRDGGKAPWWNSRSRRASAAPTSAWPSPPNVSSRPISRWSA